MLAAGLLLVGRWSFASWESRSFQARASRTLDAALRAAGPMRSGTAASAAGYDCSSSSVATRTTGRPPGFLGRIEIPQLHISAIVAEGSDAGTLRHAVGHISTTALPGAPGNCGLAGHRDTFLRGLGNVRVHDVIRIVTLQGTHTYKVQWSRIVEPRSIDVLDSTSTRSLTLVTCYPFAFVGHASRRFIVRAREVEFVAAAIPAHHADGEPPQTLVAAER